MSSAPNEVMPPPNRVSRAVLVFGVLLAAALIVGGIFWQRRASQNAAKPAAAQPAGPSDLVTADENQLKQIVVEAVGERAITVDRDTTGRVGFNEDRLTPVFTPYAGRVVQSLVNKGDHVRSGQPLVVLESPDVINAQNALVSARSDQAKAGIARDIARTSAERARRLAQNEALATKELQQAEAELARSEDEYRRTQAAVAAAENLLLMFGKKPEEIAQGGARPDNRIVIRAPLAGTVVDRKIGPGQYVKPDAPDPLLLISDLSTLWVLADVYESDLAGIRVGMPVEISVAAYPDRTFPARISLISPTVDAATRTIRVRCLVDNPGGLLKPDMFAKIKIAQSVQRSVPAVPASAVVSVGNEAFVFVAEGAGRFRRRAIRAGRESGGYVVVDSGLHSGERIVTRGSLLLNELRP